MFARDCLVVIECLIVDCFPVFTVLCALGVTVRDVASVRSTSPSASSSHQVRGIIYHAYNFQLTCLGIGYNDCLILPPYIHASQINPNSHVPHIPANHVLLCYYCSLLSTCLVWMLGCYQLLPPVTPWIGLPHYLYCCVWYDYYNFDYIRRRMEGLGYPALTLCSIRVT